MDIESFPTINAELLSNEKVTFPDFLKGKKVMISIVFEKWGAYMKPQLQSNDWQTFWANELQPRGIDFYEIPMMSGAYKIGKSYFDSAMRSELPKATHEKIACFYGNKMKYAKALGIDDISECFICIIDEEGNILISTMGAPSPQKKAKLLSSFQNSLKSNL